MIKKIALSLTLLIAPAYLAAIQLESEILHFIDGTIVDWDSIRAIKQYQKKIKHFLKMKRTVESAELKLFDFAVKEKNGTITAAENALFSEFITEFTTFSEPFIVALNPVKDGISPLVKESCARRNRNASILLTWTTTDCSEHELFMTHIKSYRALAELCMDLLNFTEDLLSSCPKAMKAYHNFIDHFTKIEPLVDALLVADQVTISRHGVLYCNVVKYITEHYGSDEEVTTEKTAKLYHAYNIKKRL